LKHKLHRATVKQVARGIIYAALALLGLVILIGIGWIAALVYVFVVACVGLIEWLLGRADDVARERGGWRISDGDS
jgi:TM2 domain-containing membrane protein YozV